MINLLAYAILLGAAAATAVTLFRALPPGKGLAKTGRKPWACDICMSFWSTLLLALAAGALGLVSSVREVVAALPAYMICLWFVKQTQDIVFPNEEEQ
jgi:hypothetical protein